MKTAAKKPELSELQKAALFIVGPDWAVLKNYVRSATLLSLQSRGLIECRNRWDLSLAQRYPYNTCAWEWRLAPVKA